MSPPTRAGPAFMPENESATAQPILPGIQSHVLPGPPDTSLSAPAVRYLLLGICLLAAVLRVVHLGSESLWMDEILSVSIARLDWSTFSKVISHFEANMVLYYGLLRLWIPLGESEAVVRGPSAIAGCLALPVFYALGRRLFSARVALVSSLLLAVNTFHIQFSQEARAYALVVLLVCLSVLFFVRAIERNSKIDWAGYVVASTLAVYGHFLAGLITIALLSSVVLLPLREVPWKRLLISTFAIGVLLLPAAWFVLTRDHGQLGSVPRLRPTDVYTVFEAFTGGGKLLLLVYFVLCCIAFAEAMRVWSRWKRSLQAWHYGILLSWLFVPILIGLAVSFSKPLLVARYFIICLPALVMLAGIGIAAINSRWIAAASLSAVVALSGYAIWSYYTHPEKENWREATTFVVDHALPKDGVFFYIDTGRLGFDYYLRRLGRQPPAQIVFPSTLDWGQELSNTQPDEPFIQSLSTRYDRLWLVLSHEQANPERRKTLSLIESSVARSYPAVTEQAYKGVRLRLYSRNGPSTKAAGEGR